MAPLWPSAGSTWSASDVQVSTAGVGSALSAEITLGTRAVYLPIIRR